VALVPEYDRNEIALPGAPSPHKAVQFCPVPGHVCQITWSLTKYFGDNVDRSHMYAEMGNNEGTEIQLKFLDLHNSLVFVTTPTVGGKGIDLTAAKHAVITQILCPLNEQRQVFAQFCLARAKQCPIHMITVYRAWCL
jgi:hypothetical protein